ncbi:MAG: CHAT domain-containing protein [Candidatus Krumholzibacteria bacterium]|nr:CHAT domain-containing protein [Candidatus Krumholzibacteria bacterium]
MKGWYQILVTTKVEPAYRGIIFLGLGLFITIVFGVAPVLSVEDDSIELTRLASLTAGQTLLDNGANQAALFWADSLFFLDVSRLEILDVMIVAAERMCVRDSVLRRLERRLEAESPIRSTELFLKAVEIRGSHEFLSAAENFRQAASVATGRGDTVSTLTALFNAVDCLTVARETQLVSGLLDEIDTLLPTAHHSSRWVWEAKSRRARLQVLTGANAEAESLYREILDMARLQGHRGLVCSSLDGLGAIMVQRSSRPEAIPFYEESLAEADILGDVYHQSRMLINLAYNQAGRRDNSEPRRLLDEAEQRIRSCGLEYLLGYVNETRAVCMEGEIRRPEAIVLFQSAAEQHAAVGNTGGELGSRQRMGYNLAMQGRFLEAQKNFEICLDLLDGKESGWMANWVLWGLANIHRNLGNLDTALDYYERALAVGRGLGSRTTVAGNLSEMGLTHALLGRYHQAIVLQHEALDILVDLGRDRGAARIHARIGDAYFHLGNLNSALDHYQQSYDLTKQLENRELLSDAVAGMAAIHGQTGDHERASEGFREALAISRGLDDQEAIVWALIGLAEQQILAGYQSEARELLYETRNMLTDGRHFHDRARIGLLEAGITSDPAKAMELADGALTAAREGGLPADEWKCLSDLGKYQLALGDTTGAKASQLAAMEGVESLWLKVGAEELRRYMLGPAGVPYERMVNLLLAAGTDGDQAREALAIAERSRARILSHRLAVGGARTPVWMGGGLSDREREIAAAIAMLQSRLQEGELEDQTRSSLKEEIRSLEQDFQLLRLKAGQAGEKGGSTPGNENQDLLAGLASGETALFFHLGSDHSYLFAARDGGVKVWKLPAKDKVEARLRMFLGLWTQMNLRDPRNGDQATLSTADFRDASKSLFDYLFGQAAEEIAAAQSLIIIPDGLLHRLPFALLPDDQGIPLGDRNIFLAPSLEVLARLRSYQQQVDEDHGKPSYDAIAIGCGLNGGGTRGDPERLNPFTGRPLGSLPQAESEALLVAGMFDESLLLTGDQATEAGFRDLSHYRAGILHIAAHGVADEKEVRRSFVVLNPPREMGGARGIDDGILQWYEVSDLSLDIELVALSSCSSASGVLAKGEGITGLTQAFLFAGASCVLGTLTDVPDSYAAAFMEDFYRDLKGGMTAAAALSSAQRKARLEGYGFPGRSLWAAFTLVGDGGISVTNSRSGLPVWYGLKILILLGLVALIIVGVRKVM